ncbi:SPASM domain-containing protein [Lacrimispora amygdalina]|uniref:SPASM domain-containing protein n=1 Tax=Lacrimispora amygdalina TaxID=253257 RepID=UPI001A9A4B8A|nr:SPASM domain-containing protein [Lacrimispora amygdalina]
MIKKYDMKNKFISMFNPKTGAYLRTGVLDLTKIKKDSINADPSKLPLRELGKIDTGEDPFMVSYPELIDIGVMGHCVHGTSGLCLKSGVQCYQDGLHTKFPNMTLENFKRIVNECKGKTYQFALGGRGDVDQHENFEEILKYCRENGIVPNFTSSGLGFNNEIISLCKKYCGAVAISWYRQYHTLKAIQLLLDARIKTNIHYVLGKNSIDEAIERLQTNSFPKGINAIIFLLHKPVGLGQQNNVLDMADPRLAQFFELIDCRKFSFKIGFDSCTVPGILNFTKNIDPASIDTCEGGRWSCYITSDMKMLPCSFDNQDLKWAYDVSNDTIQNAWNSPQFDDFRSHFRNSCSGCKNKAECRGGCPIRREIVLCNREEKNLQ